MVADNISYLVAPQNFFHFYGPVLVNFSMQFELFELSVTYMFYLFFLTVIVQLNNSKTNITLVRKILAFEQTRGLFKKLYSMT